MAKTQDRQLAQCVKVRTVDIKDNKTGKVASSKEVYALSLDGFEFEIWETAHFKASKDRWYTPIAVGYSQPYIGKDGKARNRNAITINWVEAV